MAKKHGDLIRFILCASKKPPYASKCKLRKLQSGKVRVKGSYMDLGEANWPDIGGFNHLGYWCSIEVKVGDDKLSKGQEQMKIIIEQTENGMWFLVKSQSDAIAALNDICS